MTAELTERLLGGDRRIEAAKTLEEKRAAISHRRLVRVEANFVRAMDRYEAENPIGDIAESFSVPL